MQTRTLPLILLISLMLVACATPRADRKVSALDDWQATTNFFDNGARTLAWTEAGDPNGFPVFYAHGNPGSKYELVFLHRKALEYGFRLISLDRPGLGDSPLATPYPLSLYAEDVSKLAARLQLTRFGHLGWSSGGPPVLAAATHLPDSSAFAISIAGYTDFGKMAEAESIMARYKLRGPELSKSRPKLFKQAVKMVRWTDLHLPNFYLKMAEAEMAEADRRLLNDQWIAQQFSLNQQKALKQGIEGAIQDLETQWAPWDFDVRTIKIPVILYQGQQDTFVPWEFAPHLATLIPAAQLVMDEQSGHLIALDPAWQDRIFTRMLHFID